jgi:hypothetical protein
MFIPRLMKIYGANARTSIMPNPILPYMVINLVFYVVKFKFRVLTVGYYCTWVSQCILKFKHYLPISDHICLCVTNFISIWTREIILAGFFFLYVYMYMYIIFHCTVVCNLSHLRLKLWWLNSQNHAHFLFHNKFCWNKIYCIDVKQGLCSVSKYWQGARIAQVSIVAGCKLNGQGIRVWLLAGARCLSFFHSMQIVLGLFSKR